MDQSSEQKRGYVKRLLMSRMRILFTNGFYGLLLMHMEFAIDTRIKTACTDGRKIYFGPSFLSNLSDDELDFVMMHEVMHCALQHCFRGKDLDHEGFNIACDIVVNSNILASRNGNLKYITLSKYGEAMHRTPKGDEGCYYTAEQVYEMLPVRNTKKKGQGSHTKSSGDGDKGSADGDWDDHSRWGTAGDEDVLKDEWTSRLINAAEAISVRQSATGQGLLPMCAERLLKELRKPQTDWRTILNVFVQEEITDYSFTPPDRRFDGGDFYLPDYNEKDEAVKDILFMVDTSASMSDDQITAAYSEIKGAIDQFGGRLRGWLGFFDAEIVEPKPFDSIDAFKTIRPYGGGGTRFDIIFNYVRKKMDPMPVSIIIMTDGYATFPNESAAMGIPVLWLLVNEGSGEPVNPPWGKVARVEV
ncbi:MAG: VWA-like domain-containing protein [Saccharofermentans sp.]|nr:VWA-like domain-containing protein [Saccharofermentans sp.]